MKDYVHYLLWVLITTILIGSAFGNVFVAACVAATIAIILASIMIVNYFEVKDSVDKDTNIDTDASNSD